MEQIVELICEPNITFDELSDGQHFMLNELGDVFRKVRWPGEEAYILNVAEATIQMSKEFAGKEVIPLKVKQSLKLCKA